jgi:hypothetical protein
LQLLFSSEPVLAISEDSIVASGANFSVLSSGPHAENVIAPSAIQMVLLCHLQYI